MDEIKVQIGKDVLFDIGIHSDWYISSMGYNGESVDIALRKKVDRNKEWWLADTSHIEEPPCIGKPCGICNERNYCKFAERTDTQQTVDLSNGFSITANTADTSQIDRPCDNCQEFDCYGCEYNAERSE